MIFDVATITDFLENILAPYIAVLTFGIDIAAGVVIGISAIIAFISFLRILTKPITEQIREKKQQDYG